MKQDTKKKEYYAYSITLELQPNETKEDSIRIDRGGDFVVYQINGYAFKISDLSPTDRVTIHIKDSGSGKDWFREPLWFNNILSNYSRPSLNKIKLGKIVKANDQIFISVRNYEQTTIRIQIVLEGYRIF
ncbi:MAG: hypothetical protein RMJ67_06405 [Elusimicrobiota bacterium]|nr:hypothetical protein [Endomicrobiia bacterium]MDW8166125.1 hypothetical protein [Elusimicrobiota bacterium]